MGGSLMKTQMATMALTLTLTAAALAQVPGQPSPGTRGSAGTSGSRPKSFLPTPNSATVPGYGTTAPTGRPAMSSRDDAKVKQTNIDLPPEPIPYEELGQPTIPLPEGPIDPYLLRKENGPFMIMAHTFRGPDASRYALALVLELQQHFRLPAYIFHLKIQPGHSNIRGVQPTAPSYVANADIAAPEKYRVFDEAAVLVGNCKTMDEAEKLLTTVKKLKPRTLEGLPTIWGHRKGQGLSRAYLTANPLQAAQNLFPSHQMANHNAVPSNPGQTFDPYLAVASLQQHRKVDPMVKRMNGGPHSLFKCPGPYTLQVAEFSGRTSPDANDPRFQNPGFLKKSPLATAADDAESLAANLAKCKTLGSEIQPYVFHDRVSSKVTLGAFSGPNDPKLAKLREKLPYIIGELLDRKFTQLPLAPSTELMPVPQL